MSVTANAAHKSHAMHVSHRGQRAEGMQCHPEALVPGGDSALIVPRHHTPRCWKLGTEEQVDSRVPCSAGQAAGPVRLCLLSSANGPQGEGQQGGAHVGFNSPLKWTVTSQERLSLRFGLNKQVKR